jgi:outer membrane protein
MLKQSPNPINRIFYLKLVFALFLFSSVVFLLYKAVFKTEQIAYVDSGKIFNEYKGAADARKAFQVKSKVWQSNIDTLTGEVKNNIQKYEKSLATMSSNEQLLNRQLIQTKQKQLQDYQRAIQENAKQENDKLTQGIVVHINSFLTNYGKKNNYKLILIANPSGTIAYAREGLDITADVIEGLNSEYQNNTK